MSRRRSSPTSSSSAASSSSANDCCRSSRSLPELFVLAIEHFGATEMIDGAMLGGGHQPRAGVVRNARCGPLLQRGHERIVREIFGKPHIAHHAREGRNDFRGFDAPDRVDGAMGVGSRHGYRSHHLQSTDATTTSACRALADAAWCSIAGPGAKSSSSKKGRSSTSPSSNGTRLAHSIASSLDFTWMIQNPATSSFDSANGPSTTVRLLPEYLMRAPFELGLRPDSRRAYPGFHQFFVVLRHVGENLLARHRTRLPIPCWPSQSS